MNQLNCRKTIMRHYQRICSSLPYTSILRRKCVDKMRIRIFLMLQIAVADLKEFVIADLRFRIRTLKNHDCGFAVAD